MSLLSQLKAFNLICLVGVLLIVSCQTTDKDSAEKTVEPAKQKNDKNESQTNKTKALFTKVNSGDTGIDFNNMIVENEYANYAKYEYFYNGGGVATGDFNNDGLTDLFFTGNMVPNKLYLNLGDLKFQDISKQANISFGPDWTTGVTTIDINNDGHLDLYVCRSGWFPEAEKRKNQLFVNQADGTFVDEAKKYGIDDSGYSTQATFFDYDNDGDLDLYVMNHPNHFRDILGEALKKKANPPKDMSDNLYRNDNGKFTDVSKKAGISNYGHGLGLVASDLNGDGWVDLYVGNDYLEPDYIYENNGNGTFTDKVESYLKHMSNTTMGVDAADFNNDGLVDIFSLDMIAEDNFRQKVNMAAMNPDLFDAYIRNGFYYQYMRNALQLNNGNGTFSEIGQMAGVWNTDWSWTALFADFDLDGNKDLFVTNGLKRDILHKDLQKKIQPSLQNSNPADFAKASSVLPTTKLNNYVFKNNGDLTFKKATYEWGLNDAVNSNGAVYADLDNDGDLDLVISNADEIASVYKNNAADQKLGNYIQIQFEGPKSNQHALGAQLKLKLSDGSIRVAEQTATRGYQSAIDLKLHIGLGGNNTVKELIIRWPDGKEEVLSSVKENQVLKLKYSESSKGNRFESANANNALLSQKKVAANPVFTHSEEQFNDYKTEVLLPHKLSQNGPSLASGDVNGDGLDDFYIGGAKGESGALYLQQNSGSFKMSSTKPWSVDSKSEDITAIFFDADGDQDLDLYVVSGSNELKANNPAMQDRLYMNDGKGSFTKNTSSLPKMPTSGGAVAAADFDKDGDLDLFVGGRVVPQKYPFPPKSYLLKNESGKFEMVAGDGSENSWEEIGMVNDAKWADYDGDGDVDLLLAGEWMAPEVFKNEGGKLSRVTSSLGLIDFVGWWNCIEPVDIDGDGDLDFAMGNLGLNSKNRASFSEPFHIYCDDFDKNGSPDIVLGYFNKGVCYPVRGKQCSTEQMPFISTKFTSYEAFGNASLTDVYGQSALDKALHYEAREFRSGYFKNTGNKFSFVPFDNLVQTAPTNSILVNDFDEDGKIDLLALGNQYPVEVETGRYDAHRGTLLKGDGSGFKALTNYESGLYFEGDIRNAVLCKNASGKKPILVAAENNAPVQLFKISLN